jgi:hypothetical protein
LRGTLEHFSWQIRDIKKIAFLYFLNYLQKQLHQMELVQLHQLDLLQAHQLSAQIGFELNRLGLRGLT